MEDRKDGGGAFTGSLLHFGETQNIAGELIGQNKDIRKLFLSLTRFMDDQSAMDHCEVLYKAIKHKLPHRQQYWEMVINSYPAVKESRANLIADVLTQIRRIENADLERRAEQRSEATTTRR